MEKPLVIITAPVHPWLLEKLDNFFNVEYTPAIDYPALSRKMNECEGLIVSTRLPIDKPLLEKAVNLKWIGRLGSGMELIDLEFAKSRNIEVVSSPEGNRNAVAEHALGMLLGVMRNIHSSYEEVKVGLWNRSSNRGSELRGKTIGIIGYGNTGSQFAKLLAPFDVVVIANDIYKNGFAKGFIKEASLEHIQRYADVISFHVPLNESTLHMANENFFSGLKQKPIILNTSRGGVLHLPALKAAMETGMVSGAALDVLQNEKPATRSQDENDLLQWFYQQPNVLITPHIAGYSHESYLLMPKVLVEKLKHLFPG